MSFKTVTEQVHNPTFQALAIILSIAIGLSLTWQRYQPITGQLR